MGKVEKKILDYLSEKEQANIATLCHYIAGNIEKPGDDWPNDKSYSCSVYKSVFRAVKSLECKGYLRTEKTNPHGRRGCLTRKYDIDYATRALIIYKC